jgi:hypothetical protein
MKKTLLSLFLLTLSFYSNAQLVVSGPGPLTFAGFTFDKIYDTGELQGELTAVEIEATLSASVDFTYANDLTIYVTEDGDINSVGILQVGGFSDLGALERQSWPCGAACDSDGIGTIVSGLVTLDTPIDFSSGDYAIWIGNGYGGAGTEGTWIDITISLFGVSETPASSSSFDSNLISVYPNPATSVVNLSSKNGLTFENVTIVDVNGRTVKTVVDNQTQLQINVSDLTSGVYFMNIETNEGKTVKKFIKN